MNVKSRLLLGVIYLAFVSLGLPDSLLGPAWPMMYVDLQVPVHFAGIISMIAAGGTVVSSLLSARLINRLGVAPITTFSVLVTALALLGFSVSQHFSYLCLLAVPLGLGAGCVDAGLNNYVALHYRARHMNWLHSFWGVGAAMGPMIMAAYLSVGEAWTSGYRSVGWIQLALFAVLLASTPLWVRNTASSGHPKEEGTHRSFYELLKIKGVNQALVVFFCYCTIEATFGLWGASFLVFTRGVEPEDAAKLISVYFMGITAGRFASGFLSERLSNKQLVYLGEGLIGLGLLVLLLPVNALFLPGFLLVGLGCAPIFPSLLHDTPRNFGKKHSQAIMGMQMASAYVGITLMPLLFGKLASYTGHAVLPGFLGTMLAIKIAMTWSLIRKVA